MSAPPWAATEMVQLLADLAAQQHGCARARYLRIAEDRDVLFPVMCGWAKAIAAGVPGPTVAYDNGRWIAADGTGNYE